MTPPDPTVEDRPTRPWARAGVLVAVTSFVGIWGYVLYLSFGPGREAPRDRLDDTAWVAEAEAVCADTREELESLPFANELESPAERAAVIDAATDELEPMVDELDRLDPPSDTAEALAVERWLADWRRYNTDRREYAELLSTGADQPFSVTRRDRYHLDLLIDDFAKINHMESCQTPDDVG